MLKSGPEEAGGRGCVCVCGGGGGGVLGERKISNVCVWIGGECKT